MSPGRNAELFRTGLSPSQVMLGRADFHSSLERGGLQRLSDNTDELSGAHLQMIAISNARDIIMIADADHVIQADLTRLFRNDKDEFRTINDTVAVYQIIGREIMTRWHLGCRVVRMVVRRVQVERRNRRFDIHIRQSSGIPRERERRVGKGIIETSNR